MSEDKDPNVSMVELLEEFMQHIERGGRKIRTLAMIATVAGAYFAVNYFIQLVVLPYGLGITSQTVNLVDPSLVAGGVVSLVVALLWFGAGLRDVYFERRLAARIREIRALQTQLAKNYGLSIEGDKSSGA